ncbi:MAG: hypothetical protein K2Q20_15560 [Phycisphaerales bacterium]|nr:hypothetical protein [Phycisphaerales bacterium]
MAPVPQNKPQPRTPAPAGHDSLLRNLGEFFGHVVGAITTSPTAPARPTSPADPATAPPASADPARMVREEVQERLHVAPTGEKYVLRRRVIDEVEIVPPQASDGAP